MQTPRETTMNFQVNGLDCVEKGPTFVGAEIFPAMLHNMLDEVEDQGFSHIVSWQPHGRCFVVHNRKAFVQLIMPVYFRMSKFGSFQRQLNIYNYKRITAGLDRGGYYHDNFVRGRKGLCKYIVRYERKGTLTRKPAPGNEPNFYQSFANMENMQTVRRQGDTTNSTCSLTDLRMNARAGQSNTYSMPASSMFSNTLMTEPGVSNTHGNPQVMIRQNPCTKMYLKDGQGPPTLMAAMGAAPQFQQFGMASSVPTFNHCAALSEIQHPKPACYNTGNGSIVTLPRRPRYEIGCEETKCMTPDSNPGGSIHRCNQSVVSMLRYSKCDKTKRMMNMNYNCVESPFMTNETPSNKTHHHHQEDFGNTQDVSFSTAFFAGPGMDAPPVDDDDEPLGTTINNIDQSYPFDWMPQNP